MVCWYLEYMDYRQIVEGTGHVRMAHGQDDRTGHVPMSHVPQVKWRGSNPRPDIAPRPLGPSIFMPEPEYNGRYLPNFAPVHTYTPSYRIPSSIADEERERVKNAVYQQDKRLECEKQILKRLTDRVCSSITNP